MSRRVVVSLAVLILLVACAKSDKASQRPTTTSPTALVVEPTAITVGPTASPTPTASEVAPPDPVRVDPVLPAQIAIRSVNFRSGFVHSFESDRYVEVTDGRGEVAPGHELQVADVAFGDVTNDGDDDAIIWITNTSKLDTEQPVTSSSVHVYTVRHGETHLVGIDDLDPRVDGEITEINVVDGRIAADVVVAAKVTESEGAADDAMVALHYFEVGPERLELIKPGVVLRRWFPMDAGGVTIDATTDRTSAVVELTSTPRQVQIQGTPGEKFTIWSGDFPADWLFETSSRGSVSRRAWFGEWDVLPASGSVTINFDRWPDQEAVLGPAVSVRTVEIVFGSAPAASPLYARNGQTVAADPHVRVIAAGWPVMLAPDGSALIVEDVSQNAIVGCEGFPMHGLWRVPLDGSSWQPTAAQELSVPSFTPLVTENAAFLLLREGCDGTSLMPRLLTVSADGNVAVPHEIRVDNEWSGTYSSGPIQDDGTLWMHQDPGGGRNPDPSFDGPGFNHLVEAATGAVVETFEGSPVPAATTLRIPYSESEYADTGVQQIQAGEHEILTASLPSAARLSTPIVDEQRGIVYVGMMASRGWVTVAIGAEALSGMPAIPIADVFTGLYRSPRTLVALPNQAALVHQGHDTGCADSELRVIELDGSVRPTGLLFDRIVSSAASAEAVVIVGDSEPCDHSRGYEILGATLEQGRVDNVVTAPFLVRHGPPMDDVQRGPGNQYRVHLGSSTGHDGWLIFDRERISIEGTTPGPVTVYGRNQKWHFGIVSGWTAVPADGGVELTHDSGAFVRLSTEVNPQGVPLPRDVSIDNTALTSADYERVDDGGHGRYVARYGTSVDGAAGEVTVVILVGDLNRQVIGEVWTPAGSSADVVAQIEEILDSLAIERP